MVSQKEKDRKKIYNEKNRDYINARQIEYYNRTHDERLRLAAKWRNDNKDKIYIKNQKQYAKNKDEMLADNKKYREEHKNEINLQKKIYRRNNPNMMREANKKWSKNNPKKVLERQLRYIKKLGIQLKLDSKKVKPAFRTWRECILKKDNNTCQFCGATPPKKELEADHIKEKINFPELAFDINNGRTLCKKCHYKRHGKLQHSPKKKILKV